MATWHLCTPHGIARTDDETVAGPFNAGRVTDVLRLNNAD